MTDKHPPAPWTIERHAGFKLMDANGEFVAKVPIHKKDDVAWRLAKLLAAAPDLLEALKGMLDHFGVLEDNPFLNKKAIDASKAARAAIAKAEGRS